MKRGLGVLVVTACMLMIALVLHGFGFPNRSELPGIYAAEHQAARETLALLPDGSFLQRVSLKSNSRVLEARGTWKYQDEGIEFHGGFLITTTDGLGQPVKEPGNPRYPVFRWMGKIRIGGDACDGAIQYEKQ